MFSVLAALTVQHLDFLVFHEAEHEGEYLHEHWNVSGEEEDPNIICRPLIVVGIWAKPEIMPVVIEGQRIKSCAEAKRDSHEDVRRP